MTAVLALVVVVLPFAAAGATLFLGHRAVAATRGCAVGASGLGLLLAVVLASPHVGEAVGAGGVLASTPAAPAIELAAYVDGLSAVVLLLATVVAFLVQVYSLAYLREDPRYPSYAALVAIFTGAMSMVVVADDLWVLLVGWELMGACSYFLISHHWERHEARAGAVKAYLMTRTADVGLLFAIILLGSRFGTYRISEIMGAVADGGVGRNELWLPAVLLVAAAVGKSAQVPLHTWLPDAMPGPTPISALIHAATMVAAGVFLVARTYPLFLATPVALDVLAVVAAVTMLVAAVHALASSDLKRVLAWSTVSQLAYMFGGLAVGSSAAAVLHLLSHGAFKALLFLAAGSVAHAVGSTSMAEMGGLRRRLPVTFVTMTLGFGALAGVVPLVGFFTKDAVLGAALAEAEGGRLIWGWLAWALLVSGLVTVVLTMAYAARAWLLVFFGEPAPALDERVRSGESVEPPHESPPLMTIPLVLLAIPTVLGGVAVFFPERLLGGVGEAELTHLDMAVLTTVLVALVLAGVVLRWRGVGRGDPWRAAAVPLVELDRVYDAAVVRPVARAARLVRLGDRDVIDTYVGGAGASARGLGWLLRRAQNGNVQAYLMVVVVGAVAVGVAAGALS